MPATPMKQKAVWSAPLKGVRDIGSRAALSVAEGVISVFFHGFSTNRSTLRLHDMAMGEVIWQIELDGTVTEVQSMDASTLVIYTMQGMCYRYDLAGNEKGNFRVALSNIWAGISCSDTDVIINEIHGGGAAAQRVNLHSEEVLWRNSLESAVKTPVLADDTYYCSTITRAGNAFDFDAPYLFTVYALDAATGDIKWEQIIDHYPLSAIVQGDWLIIGSREAVVILDRAFGIVTQVLDLSHDPEGIYRLSVEGNVLYTLSEGGILSAFDLEAFYECKYSRQVIEGEGTLHVEGRSIFVQNDNGTVFELDADDLQVRREFFVKKTANARPSFLVTSDRVFINSKNDFAAYSR